MKTPTEHVLDMPIEELKDFLKSLSPEEILRTLTTIQQHKPDTIEQLLNSTAEDIADTIHHKDTLGEEQAAGLTDSNTTEREADESKDDEWSRELYNTTPVERRAKLKDGAKLSSFGLHNGRRPSGKKGTVMEISGGDDFTMPRIAPKEVDLYENILKPDDELIAGIKDKVLATVLTDAYGKKLADAGSPVTLDMLKKFHDAGIERLDLANTADLIADNKPDDHFGEEQAAGLADLLAGLKDSPNDDRW